LIRGSAVNGQGQTGGFRQAITSFMFNEMKGWCLRNKKKLKSSFFAQDGWGARDGGVVDRNRLRLIAFGSMPGDRFWLLEKRK
jgi:hypothetical protein